MTTLGYIEQFEGKDVLVVTKNRSSIYIGRITEVRCPISHDTGNGTVAIARFNHQKICGSYNHRNRGNFLENLGTDENFHFKKADKIYDLTPAGIIEFLKRIYNIK